MKKALVGLSILAAGGTASAQSSVVLFGVVDVAVSRYSNRSEDMNSPTLANPFYAKRGSVTTSRTALTSGQYNTSRLGFRGTEDLGGGMAASFWLESGPTIDDGGGGLSAFARRSTVSLSGGFGEIRMGRDYVPTFWNDAIFDAFGAVGAGATLVYIANGLNTAGGAGGFGGNPNVVRASNSIGYLLPPNLGGVYGQVQYAFNEQNKFSPAMSTPAAVNNSRAGLFLAGRLGYAKGPLDIAIAYATSTSGDNFFAGTTDSVRTLSVGGTYDFAVVKLFGQVSRVKNERDYAVTPIASVRDVGLNGVTLGLTAPIGVGLIRAGYSQVKYDNNTVTVFAPIPDPKASKFALGYVHNLSKRTALYATIARVNNKNGAAVAVGAPAFISNATFTPKMATGYDVGIRHAF